jgi:hypothetical protein
VQFPRCFLFGSSLHPCFLLSSNSDLGCQDTSYGKCYFTNSNYFVVFSRVYLLY